MRTFQGGLLLLVPAMLWTANAMAQTSYDLRSPDDRIEIRIRTSGQIRYDVLLKGRALLTNCTLSLDVDHQKLFVNETAAEWFAENDPDDRGW